MWFLDMIFFDIAQPGRCFPRFCGVSNQTNESMVKKSKPATVHENSNLAKFVSVIDNYVASDMAKLIMTKCHKTASPVE